MSVSTIQIKTVNTHPIRIEVNTSAAKGYFTGHAKIRNKPDFDELVEQVQEGEYRDRDGELLREMYDSFDGFGDADGFDEILNGKASSYLFPAAVGAYFDQFGEARKGNSKRQRGR